MIGQSFGQCPFFVAEPVFFLIGRIAIVRCVRLCGYGLQKLNHTKMRFFAVMRVNDIVDAKIGRPGPIDHRVYKIEYRRGRTKTARQGKPFQFAAGGINAFGKIASRFFISFRRGPLKSVYRLFEITDGKQRTVLFGIGTHAAVKIVTQRTDDIPLRLVGVLRLIHQDMVDLLVELKPHPLRHLAMLQKFGCAPDHIVKINCTDGMFGAAILRRKFLANA